MDRRDFVKLAPAFAAAPAVTLTATREDGTQVISADIGVLRMRPGDVLVLMIPSKLPPMAAGSLFTSISSILPAGVKCMILDNGAEVGVLRLSSDGSA